MIKFFFGLLLGYSGARSHGKKSKKDETLGKEVNRDE